MKILMAILSVGFMGLMFPAAGYTQEMTQEQIIKELRALKQRIQKLEKEVVKKDAEIERLKAQSVKEEEVAEVVEETASKASPLEWVKEHIKVSGLIEVGGAWENVAQRAGEDAEQSDLNLTTVALTVEAEVNEWVNASTTLLFEDATFGDESGLDVDEATLTIGNTEKFPLFFSAGAMYVPFGALLTHFPNDPLIDDPLTLSLGEMREKAILFGLQHKGFTLSGFVFNGDMDETY